jgi:hypothetical protein
MKVTFAVRGEHVTVPMHPSTVHFLPRSTCFQHSSYDRKSPLRRLANTDIHESLLEKENGRGTI